MAEFCAPSKKVKVEPADIAVFLKTELQSKDALFTTQMQGYYIRLVMWIT